MQSCSAGRKALIGRVCPYWAESKKQFFRGQKLAGLKDEAGNILCFFFSFYQEMP